MQEKDNDKNKTAQEETAYSSDEQAFTEAIERILLILLIKIALSSSLLSSFIVSHLSYIRFGAADVMTEASFQSFLSRSSGIVSSLLKKTTSGVKSIVSE